MDWTNGMEWNEGTGMEWNGMEWKDWRDTIQGAGSEGGLSSAWSARLAESRRIPQPHRNAVWRPRSFRVGGMPPCVRCMLCRRESDIMQGSGWAHGRLRVSCCWLCALPAGLAYAAALPVVTSSASIAAAFRTLEPGSIYRAHRRISVGIVAHLLVRLPARYRLPSNPPRPTSTSPRRGAHLRRNLCRDSRSPQQPVIVTFDLPHGYWLIAASPPAVNLTSNLRGQVAASSGSVPRCGRTDRTVSRAVSQREAIPGDPAAFLLLAIFSRQRNTSTSMDSRRGYRHR